MRTLMESLADATNEADLARLDALIHPDAELRPAGGGHVTKRELLDTFRDTPRGAESRHVHVLDVVPLSPTVGIALGSVRIPAERGFLQKSVAWAIEIRDGRLATALACRDRAEATAVAGTLLREGRSTAPAAAALSPGT